jgi:hypothetical protein
VRLDHLLSKEHTAFAPRILLAAKEVPTSITGYSTSRIRPTPDVPASCMRAAGPAPAPPDPDDVGLHCSVLKECFPLSETSSAVHARPFVELSSAPGYAFMQPRDRRCLGAFLENCIASTSVLVIRSDSFAVDHFEHTTCGSLVFHERNMRGVCDFKLQRANGGCLGARCR